MKTTGLFANDSDEVIATKQGIAIKKAQRYNIEEMFANYTGQYTPTEYWGDPCGAEVW